jgi:hypothetical protein
MDVYPREGEPRTSLQEFYSPIDLEIAGLPDELTIFNDLKFHKSWEWLMPVVKRIRGIEEGMLVERIDFMPNDGIAIHITGRDSIIVDANGNHDGDKEATYKAVVEFIKWYNENK